MRYRLSIVVFFCCIQAVLAEDSAVRTRPDQLRRRPVATTSSIPSYAQRTLTYIRQHHVAPPGYVGGRHFGNFERTLPAYDHGKRIEYQEWDVRPRVPRRNRGPERIVTGSDGRAWYTPDHYRTFIPFNESD
jgi:guanyl-specific ribonuclease Sa